MPPASKKTSEIQSKIQSSNEKRIASEYLTATRKFNPKKIGHLDLKNVLLYCNKQKTRFLDISFPPSNDALYKIRDVNLYEPNKVWEFPSTVEIRQGCFSFLNNFSIFGFTSLTRLHLFGNGNIHNRHADGKQKSSSSSQVIVWKRPHEFCPRNTVIELFHKDINPADVKQGQLGDCWLMSALACVAEYPYLVRKLFRQDNMEQVYNNQGIYHIRICRTGQWTELNLDDYFPCTAINGPIYSRANGPELWVLLIEKAFAKMSGSYAAIKKGRPIEAMLDLTGAPYQEFRFSDSSIKEYLTNGKLFAQLIRYFENGSLMTLSSTGQDTVSEATGSTRGQQFGIVPGHAYSLLQVRLISTGEELCQIRNPWGATAGTGSSGGSGGEWTGAWGDKSKKWTAAIKKELNYYPVANDGIFWMCFADVIKTFVGINICLVRNPKVNPHPWAEVREKFMYCLKDCYNSTNNSGNNAGNANNSGRMNNIDNNGINNNNPNNSNKSSSSTTTNNNHNIEYGILTNMHILEIYTENARVYVSVHQNDKRVVGAPDYIDIGVTVFRIKQHFGSCNNGSSGNNSITNASSSSSSSSSSTMLSNANNNYSDDINANIIHHLQLADYLEYVGGTGNCPERQIQLELPTLSSGQYLVIPTSTGCKINQLYEAYMRSEEGKNMLFQYLNKAREQVSEFVVTQATKAAVKVNDFILNDNGNENNTHADSYRNNDSSKGRRKSSTARATAGDTGTHHNNNNSNNCLNNNEDVENGKEEAVDESRIIVDNKYSNRPASLVIHSNYKFQLMKASDSLFRDIITHATATAHTTATSNSSNHSTADTDVNNNNNRRRHSTTGVVDTNPVLVTSNPSSGHRSAAVAAAHNSTGGSYNATNKDKPRQDRVPSVTLANVNHNSEFVSTTNSKANTTSSHTSPSSSNGSNNNGNNNSTSNNHQRRHSGGSQHLRRHSNNNSTSLPPSPPPLVSLSPQQLIQLLQQRITQYAILTPIQSAGEVKDLFGDGSVLQYSLHAGFTGRSYAIENRHGKSAISVCLDFTESINICSHRQNNNTSNASSNSTNNNNNNNNISASEKGQLKYEVVIPVGGIEIIHHIMPLNGNIDGFTIKFIRTTKWMKKSTTTTLLPPIPAPVKTSKPAAVVVMPKSEYVGGVTTMRRKSTTAVVESGHK